MIFPAFGLNLKENGFYRTWGLTKIQTRWLYSPENPRKDTVSDTRAATRHFTRDEFKEILIYANENGIKIVPEFDFPAHASAAIKSMEYRYYTSGDDKYS